jgi:hypothetical protein
VRAFYSGQRDNLQPVCVPPKASLGRGDGRNFVGDSLMLDIGALLLY